MCAAADLPESGTIEIPLAPHPKDRRRVYPCIHPRDVARYEPRPASTAWARLAVEGDWALVEARVAKASRHQIRAHFAGIDHPLAGDTLYGGPPAPGLSRHALHAHYVGWPGSAVVPAFVVRSELPGEIATLVPGDAGLGVSQPGPPSLATRSPCFPSALRTASRSCAPAARARGVADISESRARSSRRCSRAAGDGRARARRGDFGHGAASTRWGGAAPLPLSTERLGTSEIPFRIERLRNRWHVVTSDADGRLASRADSSTPRPHPRGRLAMGSTITDPLHASALAGSP